MKMKKFLFNISMISLALGCVGLVSGSVKSTNAMFADDQEFYANDVKNFDKNMKVVGNVLKHKNLKHKKFDEGEVEGFGKAVDNVKKFKVNKKYEEDVRRIVGEFKEEVNNIDEVVSEVTTAAESSDDENYKKMAENLKDFSKVLESLRADLGLNKEELGESDYKKMLDILMEVTDTIDKNMILSNPMNIEAIRAFDFEGKIQAIADIIKNLRKLGNFKSADRKLRRRFHGMKGRLEPIMDYLEGVCETESVDEDIKDSCEDVCDAIEAVIGLKPNDGDVDDDDLEEGYDEILFEDGDVRYEIDEGYNPNDPKNDSTDDIKAFFADFGGVLPEKDRKRFNKSRKILMIRKQNLHNHPDWNLVKILVLYMLDVIKFVMETGHTALFEDVNIITARLCDYYFEEDEEGELFDDRVDDALFVMLPFFEQMGLLEKIEQACEKFPASSDISNALENVKELFTIKDDYDVEEDDGEDGDVEDNDEDVAGDAVVKSKRGLVFYDYSLDGISKENLDKLNEIREDIERLPEGLSIEDIIAQYINRVIELALSCRESGFFADVLANLEIIDDKYPNTDAGADAVYDIVLPIFDRHQVRKNIDGALGKVPGDVNLSGAKDIVEGLYSVAEEDEEDGYEGDDEYEVEVEEEAVEDAGDRFAALRRRYGKRYVEDDEEDYEDEYGDEGEHDGAGAGDRFAALRRMHGKRYMEDRYGDGEEDYEEGYEGDSEYGYEDEGEYDGEGARDRFAALRRRYGKRYMEDGYEDRYGDGEEDYEEGYEGDSEYEYEDEGEYEYDGEGARDRFAALRRRYGKRYVEDRYEGGAAGYGDRYDEGDDEYNSLQPKPYMLKDNVVYYVGETDGDGAPTFYSVDSDGERDYVYLDQLEDGYPYLGKYKGEYLFRGVDGDDGVYKLEENEDGEFSTVQLPETAEYYENNLDNENDSSQPKPYMLKDNVVYYVGETDGDGAPTFYSVDSDGERDYVYLDQLEGGYPYIGKYKGEYLFRGVDGDDDGAYKLEENEDGEFSTVQLPETAEYYENNLDNGNADNEEDVNNEEKNEEDVNNEEKNEEDVDNEEKNEEDVNNEEKNEEDVNNEEKNEEDVNNEEKNEEDVNNEEKNEEDVIDEE